jgi:hypothetical protein
VSMSSMGVIISAEPHWIETAGALAEKMGAYLGLPAPEARQAGEAVVATARIILSPDWNGAGGTGLQMVFGEGARGLELSLRYLGGPSPEQLRQALAAPPPGGSTRTVVEAMDDVEVGDDRDARFCLMSRRLPLP